MRNDETLDKLYELTEKELDKLVSKGELSPAEVKAATDAVCLMHKIRHFDMDEEKYGWDEDADISERMYNPQYPDVYYRSSNGGGSYRSRGMSRNRSYNRGGYSGAKEHLIQEAQRMMDAAVNDEERMAIMGYINRLNS